MFNERTDSSMYTKDSFCNNSSHWKIVERISYCFEDFNVKFSFALIIKSINLIELARLVISSQQKESSGISNFVGH